MFKAKNNKDLYGQCLDILDKLLAEVQGGDLS